MGQRLLVWFLPVFPAVAACMWYPRAATGILVLGTVTYLLAVLSRVRSTTLLAGWSRLGVRVVASQLFPRDRQPSHRVRVSVPLAQITEGLADLLCTLPLYVTLELAITGLWEAYMEDETWKASVAKLEQALRRRFSSSATVVTTQGQTAMIVIEWDDHGVGFLVAMERSGRHSIFVDTSGSEFVGGANRRMQEGIFAGGVPLDLGEGVDSPSEESEGVRHEAS